MRRNRLVGSLRLGVVLALLGAAGGVAAEHPPDTSPARLTEVPPAPKSWIRRYPALAPALERAVESAEPLATARAAGFHERNGRVQVVAECAPGRAEDVAGWLEAAGAAFVSTAGDRVQAHVRPAMLPGLSLLPEVVRVRRPVYLRAPDIPPTPSSVRSTTTAYTTEGAGAMNVPAWRSAGHRGSGVKVGVIDPGLGGYQSLLGTELPAAAKVHYKAFGSAQLDASNPHGTACAEVIADLVPDMDGLYLGLIETDVDESNALTWMNGQGVDVISVSAGYSIGPNDGTGYSDIDSWVAAGHLWFNAAGNERLGHWQGAWTDNDGDDILDLSTGTNIIYVAWGNDIYWLPKEFDISAALMWNQWYKPATDIDLYLVRWDGSSSSTEVVAQSVDYQTGGSDQSPLEQIDFTTDQDGYYGFAIARASGPSNVDIELFVDLPLPLQLDPDVPDGSLISPADDASVVAVAAVDAQSPYSLEIYSSKGPSNGPGGALSGGLLKPDIAGYANVSTASYGPRSSSSSSFNGTSAATPHAAGAAALVWSAFPGYSASQVLALLTSRAVDMGAAGKDTDFGAGRLWLGSPPAGCSAPSTPGSFQASTTTVASGVPYTLSWSPVVGADGYELQEDIGASFSSPTTFTTTSTAMSRSHATISATTYYYRVRATASCGSASGWSATRSVTVGSGGGSGTTGYLVAGIAHAAGAAGTSWRSTLTVCNRSGATASITLTYRYSGGSVTRSATVASGQVREWDDVAVSLFGVGGSSSGAVEVVSNRTLTVSARTFNQTSAGTYGQYLPGVAVTATLASGQSGLLAPVKKSSTFRTNVGFVNLGSSTCSVRTRLYSQSGAQLGSAVTSSVPAGGWLQENDIFLRAGAAATSPAYAVVEVLTAGGQVWAYASVVDNASGDPTTVPMAVE